MHVPAGRGRMPGGPVPSSVTSASRVGDGRLRGAVYSAQPAARQSAGKASRAFTEVPLVLLIVWAVANDLTVVE